MNRRTIQGMMEIEDIKESIIKEEMRREEREIQVQNPVTKHESAVRTKSQEYHQECQNKKRISLRGPAYRLLPERAIIDLSIYLYIGLYVMSSVFVQIRIEKL